MILDCLTSKLFAFDTRNNVKVKGIKMAPVGYEGMVLEPCWSEIGYRKILTISVRMYGFTKWGVES